MKKSRRKAGSHNLRDDGVSLLGDSHLASPYAFVRGGSSQRDTKTMKASPSFDPTWEHTSLPPENRFVPQHDPKQYIRHVPRTGALQFVPAYEESTNPNPAMEEESSSSWDAIIEADGGRGRSGRSLSWSRKPKIHHSKSRSAERSISSVGSYGSSRIFRRKGRGKQRVDPQQSSVRSATSAIKRPLGTAVPRASLSPAKQRPLSKSNRETASVVSGASSSWKGTQISRLKTIFSSRAAAQKGEERTPETPPSESKVPLVRKKPVESSPSSETKQLPRKNIPPSPTRSSPSDSSSGYVGWPGTQDKRGVTTAIHSSYDDSSVGAAAFSRKKFELELDGAAAVDQEVRKWMNDQSFDESTVASEKMTPLERRFLENNSSFQSERVTEESYNEDENPADYHLAAVVADASAAARSPLAENTKTATKHSKTPRSNSTRPVRSSPPGGLPGYSGRPRSSPKSGRTGGSSVGITSASGALSIHNLFGDDELILQDFKHDPWEVESFSRPPSSTGTSVSKTSSAFFQTNGVHDKKYGIRPNLHGASSVIRRNSETRQKSSPLVPNQFETFNIPPPPKTELPQPPTKVTLAMNDRMSPSPRGFNARNVPGFRGFLDKTKDVPNLIDDMDDSESATSSRAPSAYAAALRRPIGRSSPTVRDSDSVSDVFDGLSVAETDVFSQVGVGTIHEHESDEQQQADKSKGPQLVRLPGGLTAIQTTQSDLDRRKKADDFDENLTNSDVDQFGYAKLPAFRAMAAAGRKEKDTAKYKPPAETNRALSPPGYAINIRAPITSKKMTPRSMFETTLSVDESDASLFSDNAHFGGTLRGYYTGDLSEYCVNPRQVKQLVKRYRQLCPQDSTYLTDEQYEKVEDEKKAFALLEMRSRVMEKDIERGLERQGGTVPVDDFVTTPYNQSAHRIRDAVIVSKAWRDGASPKDVITASLLTRAEERTYHVKRPAQYRGGRSPLSRLNDSMSLGYYLEPVGWVDDTDFMQLRCPSLGPRCMRGFEIFTIGDCQSILLKLTNEQCMSLRAELNDATARQLEAEENLKYEGDGGDGFMTEAEMTYLTSMEEVKMISKSLVVAEKAFSWVRERIQKLVSKYETLLVKIESDSIIGAPSSVLTSGTSYYSDADSYQYSLDVDEEKVMLARRARRAELRAEVAAREAFLAKQEAQKIREEKQLELEALKKKLHDMQEESSTAIAEKEQSVTLARAIAHETKSAVIEHGATPRISQARINDVKSKFRARMAHRNRSSPASSQQSSPHRSPPAPERPTECSPPNLNSRLRMTAGEEMFQHLDFYERSLKAVDSARAVAR